MALSKTALVVAASQSVAATGAAKFAGLVTTGLDVKALYGGTINYSITNGSAPGVAPTVCFQVSPDNTKWYDYYTVGGDIVASSLNTGSIPFDFSIQYIRALVYSHTINAITFEASVQAVPTV